MLLSIVALITYGSLYPFSFAWPEPEAWQTLLSRRVAYVSSADLLGNIALFIPYGLLGVLTVRQHSGAIARLILIVASGAVFACALQAAQFFTPNRDPSLVDVAYNMLGLALGCLVAFVFARASSGRDQARGGDMADGFSLAIILASGWALSELVPFLPALDLPSFKYSLRPLFFAPELSVSEFALAAAGVLAAASLLASRLGPPRVALLLPFALFAIACAKVVVVTQRLDWSTLLGWAAGYAAFLALLRAPSSTRYCLCMLGLFLGYTLVALEPYSFRGYAGAFHFVPFADLLEGSMLTNASAVLPRLAVFAMFLWLARLRTGRIAAVAVLFSCWIGALEFAQVFLAGRTASLTDPLLILLLAWVLSQARDGVLGACAATCEGQASTSIQDQSRAADELNSPVSST